MVDTRKCCLDNKTGGVRASVTDHKQFGCIWPGLEVGNKRCKSAAQALGLVVSRDDQ